MKHAFRELAVIERSPRSLWSRLFPGLGSRGITPVRILSPELHAFGGADVGHALRLADEMRKAGFFDSFKAFPRPADEPFIHAYYATSDGRDEAGGCSFTDPAAALGATIGETFERHLWRGEHLIRRSRLATERELGRAALPLLSFEGFSKEQRELSHLAIDETMRIRWIAGASILYPWRTRWCPLQQISGKYAADMASGAHLQEPIVRPHTTTGIATATTKSLAIVTAILEILEREAFSVAYTHRLSPPRLNLESLDAISGEFALALKRVHRARLKVALIHLPTDFPVHIICALVVDETGKGPALCVGARASFDLVRSALDALKEAIFMRYNLKIHVPKGIALPVDVKITRERLAFWEDLRNLHLIDFFFRGPETDARSIPSPRAAYSASTKLHLLRRELRSRAMDGCVVDLARGSAGEHIPLSSVFVVVPGLHPLQISSDPPYLGGARLRDLPEKLGYVAAEDLNTLPNPFP